LNNYLSIINLINFVPVVVFLKTYEIKTEEKGIIQKSLKAGIFPIKSRKIWNVRVTELPSYGVTSKRPWL